MENVPQSRASVLFIIGNGLDLSLGMRTSYSDIYESYIQTPSSSLIIEKFKKDLAQHKPYDKWSDFELGMAEYARTLCSEEELIECVRDFKRNMFLHLEAENEKIVDKLLDDSQAFGIMYEWDNSLYGFYESFSPNIVNEFRQVLGNNPPHFNFITFNYTEVLESIFSVKRQLQKTVMNPPLHIHGMLTRDVVLGVDNLNQLDNLPYPLSKRAARAFVKTLFNEEYDRSRIALAHKMILESSIICTYGFSWGKSDKTWCDLIVNWLKSKSTHHLVVFQYDVTTYSRFNFDEMMDTEENKKIAFLEHLEIEDDGLQDQIHIPIGTDIFRFDLSEKRKSC